MSPYIQFFQPLTSDQCAPSFVYLPDESIDLSQTSETEGNFRIQTSPSFANPNEDAMLRAAEAVYGSFHKMILAVLRAMAAVR